MSQDVFNQIYDLIKSSDAAVTTDSRQIRKGDIFIALKGDKFNGNRFASSALEKGAALVVVDEDGGPSHDNLVQVEDGLVFLQELAKGYRQLFDHPVIAIAGSNGKTTTKELLTSVLSTQKVVYATPGNFNNHIGLPLSILRWKEDLEIGILEVGTNSPGEVEFLCEIAQPTHGIITNIGKEHLEGFGSLEAIAREESMLYYHLLKHHGVAFVNAEDDWLKRMAGRLVNPIYYSAETLDLQEIHLVPFVQFVFKGNRIESNLSGQHNLENITAAIAIGEYFNIETESIANGISEYVPSMNRNEIITWKGATVIKDAYNANPTSMEKALKLLEEFNSPRKVAILGDMFEMGEMEASEHQSIADFAVQLDLDEVFLVGVAFSRVQTSATQFETLDEAVIALKDRDWRDTVILLKGSRGMLMETFLDKAK
jgi:UDP-N-acetylmuramoyl-tripeptide--D-alanyl-D-alanine ligase